MKVKKILAIGPLWRGSDATGLFNALRRAGHIVHAIDEWDFVKLSGALSFSKYINKACRGYWINELNQAILSEYKILKPDIVLIFKGTFVKPETLQKLKARRTLLVNFYPDVSFTVHGKWIPKALPLYDEVFTTKTFGINDLKEQLGIDNACFIPPGFDPAVHRPISLDGMERSDFDCDVSFIGGYSEKKVIWLEAIKKQLSDFTLRIWGWRWDQYKGGVLSDCIKGRPILGDLYALGVQSSKINLGLLHEQVQGASSGDRITARTFQIPACGGFMLHERTEEVIEYFEEDKEIVCFSTEEELTDKIRYYLEHDSEREKIRLAGYERAVRDHSWDDRTKRMMETLDLTVEKSNV